MTFSRLVTPSKPVVSTPGRSVLAFACFLVGLLSWAGIAAQAQSRVTPTQPTPSQPTPSQVASPQQSDPALDRPTIAVAFSGGGALGIAHIGVLQVLEELRVPIDCIAGTSMGALVGGLYATGIPASGMEGLIDTQLWEEVFGDRNEYRDMPFRRKVDATRYLVDLQLGINRGGVSLPSGLATGQELFFLLQRYTLPVVEVNDFTKLPIPFMTVATDLETGEAIFLREGDLATALRASMSLPGFFSPIELDGRILVDGGVANNLPVLQARELCDADFVIAIDVTEPLATREELKSQVDVTAQTLSFLTRREVNRQLEHAEVVIRPDVEEHTIFSFQEAESMVEAGVAAARAQKEALARFSVDEQQYLAHRAEQQRPPVPRIVPHEIRFMGSQRVDERTLRKQVQTRVGQPVDFDVLRDDLGRIYNLREFQRAIFRLEEGPEQDSVLEDEGNPILIFDLAENELSTTYLQVGVLLDADLQGETGFTAVLNATRTWLNQYGAEWRSEVSIGEVHSLFSELYQPLSYGGNLFLAPWIDVTRQREAIFEGGQRVAEYDTEHYLAGFAAGLRIGHIGEARLGAVFGHVEAEVGTGTLDLPEFDGGLGGVVVDVAVDAADRPTFARSGWTLSSQFFSSRSALGAEQEYERLRFRVGSFTSWHEHTVGLILDAGTDFDSGLPFYDWFSGGGATSFAGYAQGQLRGRAFTSARLLYYNQLRTLSPTQGRGVYAGMMLDVGNYWRDEDSISLDDLKSGAGIFVGADTVLGPALLGYGYSDEEGSQFYLSIGRPLR